jgi:hypothetical protein
MGISELRAEPRPTHQFPLVRRLKSLFGALLTVGTAIGATPATAQQGVIVYDHGPALPSFPDHKAPRFIYPKSTDETPAIPYLIEIPKGGELCLRVENANWLLYKYEVKVDTVKAPDIPGLGDFLGGVTAFIGKRVESMRVARIDTTALGLYVAAVRALGERATAIDSLKWHSDVAPFQTVYANASEEFKQARVTNELADTLWSRSAADPPDGKDLIRTAQAWLMQRATAGYKQFEAAAAKARDPVCAKVNNERLKVTFSISAAVKPDSGRQLIREVSNAKFIAEVEPVTTDRVEVATGLIAGFLSEVPRFSLVDDRITADSSDADFFRPGVFLMVRPWTPTWLWATVGATTGKSLTQPDLFAGFSIRTNLGGLTKGFSAILGAGYLRTAAVSGLSNGAVGETLPAGISDLEKIVKRSYRGAFGLFLSVSGLELKKK